MATAARTQTIVVQQPRRSVARRAGRAFRRARTKLRGPSGVRLRDRQNVQTIALGGISALAFGLIQGKVKLPGITGVPNSLTYGAGLAATAIVAKSDKLLKIATGPLFAGLHNIGLRGVGQDVVAGEWDDNVAGEFDSDTSGGQYEQQEVTAGEFDDL